MQLNVSVDRVMATFGTKLEAFAHAVPAALAAGLNEGGADLRTVTVKAEAAQTGLSQRIINRAQKAQKATPGVLAYKIRTSGGNVRLKYFGARETRAGVSAAPWGRRQVFGGTFTKGGAFPKRVALPKLGGHVFKRAGKDRLPIEGGRSGLYIPTELTKGPTLAAFNDGVTRIEGRIVARLGALLPA